MNKPDLERHAAEADSDAARYAADPHGGPLARLRRLDALALRSMIGRPSTSPEKTAAKGRP